jgi:hypothetical protein
VTVGSIISQCVQIKRNLYSIQPALIRPPFHRFECREFFDDGYGSGRISI